MVGYENQLQLVLTSETEKLRDSVYSSLDYIHKIIISKENEKAISVANSEHFMYTRHCPKSITCII